MASDAARAGKKWLVAFAETFLKRCSADKLSETREVGITHRHKVGAAVLEQNNANGRRQANQEA